MHVRSRRVHLQYLVSDGRLDNDQMFGERTDVWRDRQTGKISTPLL
jgi:hypothetical protein